MIWLKNKDWLIVTKKSDTDKNSIINNLQKKGFVKTTINFSDKDIEVWSKLTANLSEKPSIKNNIEVIIEENQDEYIWSKSLIAIINANNENINLNNQKSERKIDQSDNLKEIFKIHLGKQKTNEFFYDFYPYNLFRAMVGKIIDSPQKIDISIAIPKIENPDWLKFKLNLS